MSSMRPVRALLLVDHGSRSAEANHALDAVATRLQALPDFPIVRTAHLEHAAPDIPEGFESCVRDGAEEIVVHPYFLAPGRHVMEDIPRRVREAAARHPGVGFRVTAPLGPDLRMAEIVLDRVRGVA